MASGQRKNHKMDLVKSIYLTDFSFLSYFRKHLSKFFFFCASITKLKPSGSFDLPRVTQRNDIEMWRRTRRSFLSRWQQLNFAIKKRAYIWQNGHFLQFFATFNPSYLGPSDWLTMKVLYQNYGNSMPHLTTYVKCNPTNKIKNLSR